MLRLRCVIVMQMLLLLMRCIIVIHMLLLHYQFSFLL
jgi:hypothetical protein